MTIGSGCGAATQTASAVEKNPTDLPFERKSIDPNPPTGPWYKLHADFDRDGDEDISIGGRNGPLVWYEHPGWEKHRIAPR